MLIEIVSSEDELPKLINMINKYQSSLKEINLSQEEIISSIGHITSDIFNKTRNNFNDINNDVKRSVKMIGISISSLIIVSILLIILFTYFYLQKNLNYRFNSLINSVELLNKGSEELDIKLDGKDEITEINFLLQKYTEILKDKNRISKNLQQTQNELIQAAKLAIVGKTMTTLAHEINQPLNVLSIYIFSLKKMVMQKSY